MTLAAVNLAPFMVALTIVVFVFVAWALMRPVRGRAAQIAADDAELARRQIAVMRGLPTPDELYRAPDVPKAVRRRFTRRIHPIAHKRSRRRI